MSLSIAMEGNIILSFGRLEEMTGIIDPAAQCRVTCRSAQGKESQPLRPRPSTADIWTNYVFLLPRSTAQVCSVFIEIMVILKFCKAKHRGLDTGIYNSSQFKSPKNK